MEDLERLVRDYKTKVFVELGAEFPTDPQEPPYFEAKDNRHHLRLMHRSPQM